MNSEESLDKKELIERLKTGLALVWSEYMGCSDDVMGAVWCKETALFLGVELDD